MYSLYSIIHLYFINNYLISDLDNIYNKTILKKNYKSN